MDSLAELQRQNALLQQQNEQLRAGRNQANNQAEFLRQQQSLQGYSQQDAGQLNVSSHDWFTELGFGQQQPAQQAAAQAPPPEPKLTLTPSELQRAIQLAAKQEAAKQVDTRFQAQAQAQSTQQALQQRLVQEHPDLAQNYAPVIDEVWRAKQMEMRGKTPQEIYAATIQKTQALVQHVQSVSGPQGTASNPYGITPYGAEGMAYQQQQVKQDPNDIFQAVPGNERPEWRSGQEARAVNKERQSKALFVGYTPAARPTQQAR